jgi:predicted DNA-binding transcriptional regulator AlpA
MATHSTQSRTSSNPAPVALPITGFIRLADLVKFVPFGKSSVWRKVNAGEFPEPVKLSAQVTAWRAEDVHAWITHQAKAGAEQWANRKSPIKPAKTKRASRAARA